MCFGPFGAPGTNLPLPPGETGHCGQVRIGSLKTSRMGESGGGMDGRGGRTYMYNILYCICKRVRPQGSILATSDNVGCRVVDEAVLKKSTQNRLHTTQATNTVLQNKTVLVSQ
jgi:hypothetical protein